MGRTTHKKPQIVLCKIQTRDVILLGDGAYHLSHGATHFFIYDILKIKYMEKNMMHQESGLCFNKDSRDNL